VCAVIDGFGDESSTAFYRYSNGIILPIAPDRISRNSLGHFYNRVCISCGYDPDKGDHWRLMGLAPTGSANRALLDALRGTLTVRGLEIAGREQMRSCPVWDRPGDYPQADIARAGQEVFEEVMTELLGNLCSLELSENLILTGGCALNSTYNGKVLAVTGFSELHIPPAPADDGNAIGAALLSYIADGGRVPRRAWQSPYLGSTLSGNSLSALAQNAREGSVRVVESGVERVAAKALAEGKIIGWVQGAAEFGPRALGNRSILANPGQADMAERIRATVKEREAFRPFAPAILHEHGDAYFCEYQASPYMERTLRYRSVAAGRVPAVVHVDNTGRVQSVKREWNPSFHRLIDEFYKETNIPIVLNTSLNISGKPIVHSLEDAIGMLFTTGLDAIILENYYIEK
jgi:carbamoyltransferase